MRSFLRTLAFPIACAFTGAAAALFVVSLNQAPPPACPAAPTIHIQHEMAPLPPPRPAVAPIAILHPPVAAPAPALVAGTPKPRLAVPEGAVRCVEAGRCVVDLGFYQTLREDPSLLKNEAHILPSIKDGQVRGLKFYGIRPGSLPNLLGLKNGDMLTSLNGVPINTEGGPSIAEAVVRLIRDRSHPLIRMEIERKGQPIAVAIDVAALQEAAPRVVAAAR
ncbi:hypothetical protein SAMN02745121_03033 [Nannocystis exedens]|uniref:PDZ domain-containing protein n=1 Tax=Nannocystis exedens TaxID=54 RepID=A0A1I1XVX0_9BACT|nr:hypothetical protein [Nannocystis exedens]PCC73240.1 general secretion pathway protein GspC [Nannocystis exedens]SFE10033.1 hypothetical protein SAMN02745121_03033 [Nannocystis exedens]